MPLPPFQTTLQGRHLEFVIFNQYEVPSIFQASSK